jgi:hypothetical protein
VTAKKRKRKRMVLMRGDRATLPINTTPINTTLFANGRSEA